jgi:hypothetical protein
MSGVDDERFWATVKAADDDVEEWSPDLDQDWANALYAHLVTLPADEVLAFDLRLGTLRRAAETPEMAAAIQLVVRPSPRDWLRHRPDPYYLPFIWKFREFVNCLVMLGRDTFERAVADPDSLADHPLIQAVANDQLPPSVLVSSRVYDAACNAYMKLTGIGESEYCDLYEASTTDDAAAADAATSADEDDEDEYGAEIDPVWLAERLPRLLAMFYPEAGPTAEGEPVLVTG